MFSLALLVASAAAQRETQTPVPPVGICTRPDGVICIEPPYVLETTHTLGNAVYGFLGSEKANPLVFAGALAAPVVMSVDGGLTWLDIPQQQGQINAMGVSGETLVVGSGWQEIPVFPEPPGGASFAYVRDPSGNYTRASLDSIPKHPNPNIQTIAANLGQRSISFTNGTTYATGYTQYTFVADPWYEFWLTKSTDNINWEWIKFPYFTGCGPVVDPDMPCPLIKAHFFDENNGIALVGQSWEGDYANEPPTTQEYVAIIATTNDGGLTWTERFRNDTFFMFSDIDCVGDVCLVSAQGLGYSIPDNQAEIYKSTDRGLTWRRVFATINDNDFDGGLLLYAIHMVDSQTVYAVGNFRQLLTVLISTDGGENFDYAFEPRWPSHQDILSDVWDRDGQLYMLAYTLNESVSVIVRLNPPQ